mgnify:CR=1 FL=1
MTPENMAPQDSRSNPIPNFLARLLPGERSALLAMATRKEFRRGEMLFKAGSHDGVIHILDRGRVKVYHLSPTGKEFLLWFCFSGEIFGLAEACHGGERQAYAQACETTQVFTIPQVDFKRFLESHPESVLLVNDILACRLRNLGHIVQSLVANDVSERVVQLITRLAASHGRKTADGDVTLDLRLTHQEMADMIGTTRQSVTTALSALRRRGALEFDRLHRIRIHGTSV